MNKLIVTFFALLLMSTSSFAGDISCSGKVTLLMADHTSCSDSEGKKQLAFRLAGSPLWKCNGSNTASSLVLAAKISNKSITVYLNDTGGTTCQSHAQYIKPRYTFIP